MKEISEHKLTEEEKPAKKQTWHCDIYCRKIRHIDCEGRGNRDENAPELCPYFDEMLY